MNIKFLDCWVFGRPAIIAFGFKKIIKKNLSKILSIKFVKKTKDTPSNTKVTKVNGLHFSCPQSQFLEAPLVRTVDGELKNVKRSLRTPL